MYQATSGRVHVSPVHVYAGTRVKPDGFSSGRVATPVGQRGSVRYARASFSVANQSKNWRSRAGK